MDENIVKQPNTHFITMKKTVVFLFLFPGFVFSQTLNIEQCYDLARKNYPLIQQNDLIAKTKEFTLENLSKNWLPQINVTGQATYQSDVTELPIQLPNVNFTPLSKDQYKIFADVSQSLFDGGAVKNQKKLAEIQSEISLKQNEAELDQLKERINQLYFGVLLTDEQLAQTALTKTDFENGLKKAEAQLKNGVIFRSNVDVLKAQLVDLEQSEIELRNMKKNFLAMLSVFIHQNLDENTMLQKPEKNLSKNENKRTELQWFDLRKTALETQKMLLHSKNSPKLGAFLQGGYGKPGLNMLKNEFDVFYMAGLRLTIPVSGFYTQKNDRNLLENQERDLEIQKENFLFNQHLQSVQNTNELQKIQELIDKDNELVTLRESIKKASLAQLENGVITTSDYIREVNAEQQAKLQKIRHEIQYLLTIYNQKALFNN